MTSSTTTPRLSAGRTARGILAGLALLAVGLVSGSALVTGHPDEPERLQLFVVPHPDDELQAWAALSNEPTTYTVFVTLTQGEQTSYCEPAVLERNLQADLGERPPEPLPTGRGTPECAAARTGSWPDFLDRAAGPTPAAALGSLVERTTASLGEGVSAELTVGTRSARVVLDLPDGGLEPGPAATALTGVLDLRGGALPDLPLASVVAAAYFNDTPQRGASTAATGCPGGCDGDPRALEYDNADHLATIEAATALASAAADGSWIATHPFDPAAGRTFELPSATYEALTGLGEAVTGGGDAGRLRTGALQVSYGWLSFLGPTWPTGDLPLAEDRVLFPRVQSFTHIEAEQ